MYIYIYIYIYIYLLELGANKAGVSRMHSCLYCSLILYNEQCFVVKALEEGWAHLLPIRAFVNADLPTFVKPTIAMFIPLSELLYSDRASVVVFLYIYIYI